VLTYVDWLASCIALRVVGAVLVFFLQRWHTICTILQPMGSYKIICAANNLKWPRSLFRPRIYHAGHQRSNSSREKVP
jgi:hypothetical protein